MFFRCVCIWIGICAAIAAQGMQRDSSSRAIGLDERLSPVALFRTSLFDNPASQVYRYNTSLTQIGLSGVYDQQQEAVVMQQGRGNRFAAFDADSYVKRNGNTVWGSAGYRVGRTMHTVWNENAAILSGDAMYSLACRYVAQAPAEYVVEVVKRFNEMALQICEGQQLDMEFESRNSVSEEEYLQMIRLKTSVLLANSLAVGGLLGGASDEAVERLYHFGLNLGMAFQLKDDLLDVYGDASVFGKKIGGDILCNKKTYLLIKALEHATPEQREALCAWLVMEQYVSSEKIAAVTALYNEIGVKHFCEIKIEEYSRHAAEYLMAINVDAAKKAELEILMKQMVHRIV